MVKSLCRVKKGPWTPEEDQKLSVYIGANGHGSWSALPAKAGLQRCSRSCRMRWLNYLKPDIKRGKFSLQEEQTIILLHALLGNRWSAIATHLPKRTDNEIKNYWNTNLKKRLDKMGIDPVTHKPKVDVFGSSSGHSKDAANLSHMAQWERARLQAEARLVRKSKLISNSLQNQVGSAATTKVVAAAPARPQCLDVLKASQAVGMFFSDGNSLESATSTLNFSDSTLPIPAIGFHENSSGMLEFAMSSNNNNDNLICKGSPIMGPKVKFFNGGNDWNCLEKLTGQIQVKDTLGNPVVVQLHEMSTYFSADNYAWLVDSFRGTAAAAGNENAPSGYFIQGLSDILISNSDEQNSLMAAGGGDSGGENGNGSCGGVNLDKEDRKYWNSFLNLVDATAPGSHVF